MDKMVFGFPDLHSRNLAGRAVRRAGYVCLGSSSGDVGSEWLLTVEEPTHDGRAAVEALVQQTSPDAGRVG